MEQTYELTYLLSPELNQDKLEKLNKKIEELVQGKFLKKEEPKKIALSYPISKKNEAFLVILNFKTEPENAARIKKELEKILEALRFLLIKKQAITEKPKSKEKKKSAAKPKEPAFKQGETLDEKTKKKVEMQQIEEELEKVLK